MREGTKLFREKLKRDGWIRKVISFARTLRVKQKVNRADWEFWALIACNFRKTEIKRTSIEYDY